jgi:DNA-binding response OmpR family regulator
MSWRILVADDDAGIRDLLSLSLREIGMDLTAVGTVAEAIRTLEGGGYDIALLDVGLPDGSGLDVLRRVRSLGLPVAVIMLTAAGSEVDRVLGLELGADDYMVKPFFLREVEARVRAVMRRSGAPPSSGRSLVAGSVEVDAQARLVRRDGQVVELTPKEYDLVHFLVSHPGQAFSREELLREVWESSSQWQQLATVTEHVRRLRAKLEEDPQHPRLIRTVPRLGYRLDSGVS